jgi:hypothetical protein
VRSYLLKLPEERQTNLGWQNITRQIMDAAQSGDPPLGGSFALPLLKLPRMASRRLLTADCSSSDAAEGGGGCLTCFFLHAALAQLRKEAGEHGRDARCHRRRDIDLPRWFDEGEISASERETAPIGAPSVSCSVCRRALLHFAINPVTSA